MAALHRKRCQRYDVPGDAHFLTFSCFRRQPFLSRDRTRAWFVEALDSARKTTPFDLWAWVIMPKHVHLVLLPQDHTRISSILSAIKQPVSKQAIAWLKKNNPRFLTQMEDLLPNGNRAYRFWQRGGGYDRNLRGAREIHEKIRYVHENPVRRGLVPRAEDWPWSSALAWLADQEPPLRIDRESVPSLALTDADTQSRLWR